MRFSILSILTLLLFLSCEEALEYNPLDPDNNPDFVEPETVITIDNLEGTTLDTSTVTITFAGNDGVVEYAYKLSDGDWSAWSTDTSATLSYIDDGDHVFSVKGRYIPGVEDETPATVNFSVDMVEGPGIRVYKLLTEMSVSAADSNGVSTDSTQHVSIYAEEVEGLVVAKFQVKYNASMLSLDTSAVSSGEMFLGITDILFFTEEIGSGLLDVNISVLGHEGVSGTGELIRLPFIPKATGTSTIEILNAEYSNITPSPIPIVDSANGLVVVE